MRRITLPIILLLVLFAAACNGNREKVILPPEAPMVDIHRIAVVTFDNYTSDPGIGRLAQDHVIRILDDSGQYQVIDPIVTSAIIAEMGIEPQQLASPETAKEFGSRINADAIIMGEVLYYHESTTVLPPSCFNCRSEGKTPSWSTTHRTEVSTSMRARVIKTQTGAIIWTKSTEGKEQTNRYIDLPHKEQDAPPPTLIPAPDTRDIPRTREASVLKAVREFTKDLLPREIWVRVE